MSQCTPSAMPPFSPLSRSCYDPFNLIDLSGHTGPPEHVSHRSETLTALKRDSPHMLAGAAHATQVPDLEAPLPTEGGDAEVGRPFRPDVPCGSPHEQLYDLSDNSLSACGFAINRRLKALICLACAKVVPLTRAVAHLSTTHPDSGLSLRPGALNTLAQKDLVTTGWPLCPPPSDRPRQYQGLPCVPGYACPRCLKLFASQSSFIKHVKSDHSIHISAVQCSTSTTWIQRFSSAHPVQSYFEVTPLHHPQPGHEVECLDLLRAKLDEPPHIPTSEVDPRHISPWNSTTGWHHYVDNYDAETLSAMIRLPESDDPLYKLSEAVRTYMQTAYDSILDQPELARQIINTDTPNT